MHEILELVAGYRTFLRDEWPQQAARYRSLAELGQTPRTMIVGCCDSRVDPSRIFGAGPGQLFVVRNVANLVPPCEAHGHRHGTSAALEFAVTGLQVENIVVLGHARCGGVEAFIDRFLSHSDSTGFISEWMSMLRPAWAEVLASDRWKGPIELRQALEHASIRHSIENLKTFPFIQERIDAGDLKLHGAYFDIATGQLLSLDRGTRAFQPVA